MDIFTPSFGESVHQAQVGTLFVENGAAVNKGQDLLELETDKLNQTIAAPTSGVVLWKVKSGDLVSEGAVLASIDERQPEQQNPIVSAELEKPVPQHEAKKAAAVPSNKDESDRKPMSQIRQAISRKLVQACRETAMVTTFQEVDMHKVIAIREEYKKEFFDKFGVKLGFMSFFVKAAANALKKFPIVNAHIEANDIVMPKTIDIGVAVATERGLIVPIIRQAGLLSYADIEKTVANIAKKARDGALVLEDIEGGSFTITNGGVFGSLLSTPILNSPQSAILGMHTIQKRAVVVNDEIIIRPMMYLALTYDHRLIDGQVGVEFLMDIKNEIEDPDRLLLGL